MDFHYGFAGVGLWVWVCRYGFVVDLWWLCVVCGGFANMVVVGGGSVQCVVVCGVGLRVWWLWVCSGPILMVGLQWTDFDFGFVVVMSCGFCRWWLWVVDFVVVVDGILWISFQSL